MSPVILTRYASGLTSVDAELVMTSDESGTAVVALGVVVLGVVGAGVGCVSMERSSVDDGVIVVVFEVDTVGVSVGLVVDTIGVGDTLVVLGTVVGGKVILALLPDPLGEVVLLGIGVAAPVLIYASKQFE